MVAEFVEVTLSDSKDINKGERYAGTTIAWRDNCQRD